MRATVSGVINFISTDCQPRLLFLIFLPSVMTINLAISFILDSIFSHFTFINEKHGGQFLFPDDIPHCSLYFGCLIRWQYSNNSPASPSITELAYLHVKLNGNLLAARFWLDNSAPVPKISSIRISVSFVLNLWISLK